MSKELTDDWIECFEEDRQAGTLAESVFWRLAIDVLPEGVDGGDPRVAAALEEIRLAVEKRRNQ